MTAVWCSVGYYFVNHSLLVQSVCHIGHLILPLVLIGLGIYIMVGGFTKSFKRNNPMFDIFYKLIFDITSNFFFYHHYFL